jgi:preprotein translocase subunit YajC
MPSLSFAEFTSEKLSSFGGLLPIVFIFIFFYFFLMRPQQKKAKEHRNLLNSLKKNDEIITAGGIYAIVNSVEENIVEVKIADDVYVRIAKQSISVILTKKVEENKKQKNIINK